MSAPIYIGPRPTAPPDRLIEGRIVRDILGDQDFTDQFIIADSGHPQFPFWRTILFLILATQVVLLIAQQSEMQLRYRPRNVPRPSRISRTHSKQANAVRLTRILKEARQ